MATVLRVTDDSERAEIAEQIALCCRTAKRAPHVVSPDPLRPSEWDLCHARLNALLSDWETAQ